MKEIKFGIRFGAMAPRLSEQIEQMGLKYNTGAIINLQQVVDSLLRVRFADLLTDKAYESAQRKLYKQIEKHILQQNKLKRVSTHDTTKA